jgi:hypothetical protein
MNLDQRAGLHAACQRLAPIHPDYSTLPVTEGFNWSSYLGGAPFPRLYLVVFRSVRREEADLQLLREYDDRAYAGAVERGGNLRYFKGEMNERRECLSFCFWESRERAKGAGACHREAAEITAQIYESYELERYEFAKAGEGDEILFRRLGENGASEVGERHDTGYSSGCRPV